MAAIKGLISITIKAVFVIISIKLSDVASEQNQPTLSSRVSYTGVTWSAIRQETHSVSMDYDHIIQTTESSIEERKPDNYGGHSISAVQDLATSLSSTGSVSEATVHVSTSFNQPRCGVSDQKVEYLCHCSRKPNCILSTDDTELTCSLGFPCHIPSTVSSLVLNKTCFSDLMLGLITCSKGYSCHYHGFWDIFNVSGLTNSPDLFQITKMTLGISYTRVPHMLELSQYRADFLNHFPSLKTLVLLNREWIDCAIDVGDIAGVRSLVASQCSFDGVDNSGYKSSNFKCVPNLESLEIIQVSNHLQCSYNSGASIKMDLAVVKSYLPNLKLLSLKPRVYREVFVFASNETLCNHPILEEVRFASLKIWSSTINIRGRCKYPLVVFQDNDSYIEKVQNKPDDILIRGFQTVKFLFRIPVCKSRDNKQIYGKITFSYDTVLDMTQHCNQNMFEMSIDNYHSDITYVLWYLHQLELSDRFEMNLSSLGIVYFLFHEGRGGSIRFVKDLLLDHNQLGTMAKLQSFDFKRILYAFANLEKINLVNNAISDLPKQIFSKSIGLKTIKLSNNKISILRMEHFIQLSKLEILDLSNNNIKTSYAQLELINLFLLSLNGSTINMTGNEFVCSCSKLEVFTSIISLIDAEIFIANPECYTDDSYTVRFSDLEKHCQKQKMILFKKYSLSITGILIIVALLTIVIIWRIRKQKRLVDRFVDDVKNGRAKMEFLMFLSYSSVDGDMVRSQIMPEIEKRLSDRTGVDKEHICTGDSHFKPGFYIIHEAIRCIGISSTVVFVISKPFIDSEHCRMEVREALSQEKPIILIMAETIYQDKMPGIIKSIFNKYSRFHFIRDNTGVDVLPSWDVLVSSVFDLAANNQKDLKNLGRSEHEKQNTKGREGDIEMYPL